MHFCSSVVIVFNIMIWYFLGAAWVAWENEALDFKKDHRISWWGGINFGGLHCILYKRPRPGRKDAGAPTVNFGCWGRDVCSQDVEDAYIWDKESRIRTIRKNKGMNLSPSPCIIFSDLCHSSTVISLVSSYCTTSEKPFLVRLNWWFLLASSSDVEMYTRSWALISYFA